LRASRLLAVVFLMLSSLAEAQPPSRNPWPVVHERKDARGRVVSRVVFQQDGTIHRESFVYGGGSAKRTLDEDLDASRTSLRRVQETYDEQGRLAEREETSDKEGRRKGKRTIFRYDHAGRQTSETNDIG
jgi:hypothetical protein